MQNLVGLQDTPASIRVEVAYHGACYEHATSSSIYKRHGTDSRGIGGPSVPGDILGGAHSSNACQTVCDTLGRSMSARFPDCEPTPNVLPRSSLLRALFRPDLHLQQQRQRPAAAKRQHHLR